jgi:hypothetical protein
MTPAEHDATIERDLRAVDAALEGRAATHDDPLARELQELALALRAGSPEPDPGFATELHARMEAGFPPEPGSPRARLGDTGVSVRGTRGRLVPSWRALIPIAGIGAPLLLVIALVVALGGGPDTDQEGDGGGGGVAEVAPSSGDDGAGSVAPEEGAAAQRQAAPPAGAGSGDSPVLPQPPGTGFAPGSRNRKIERSISMTLAAPDDEIAQVADDVTRVTGLHGGFVLRSELDIGEDGSRGSFELRIPTPRLQGALRDLAELATVRSQTQSGQDVTREHVTARDRLDAARAERRSLLRRLATAATDEEAEAIRRRLDLVAGEINGLRGQLRDLRLRTDYAIVSVDLTGDEGASGGASGSFDDALGDAGDLLVGTAGVLIRVLALALPLGLIALLAWLAGRSLRRRQRESALA